MLRVEGVPPATGRAGLFVEAPHGQCVGLLGSAPDGISRLLQTMAAMRRPLAGRVLVDELDSVRDAARVRPRVAVHLPQVVGTRLTILEHVSAVAAARLSGGGALRASARQAIERLGLDPRAPLSTPRARAEAALASALLPAVSVVVLDEPFSQLSGDTRDKAIMWIRALATEPTTIIIGSAEERDVRAVSHQVITLERSR